MGPTRVLPAPGGPHIGPMNLAIWELMVGSTPLKLVLGERLRTSINGKLTLVQLMTSISITWHNVNQVLCRLMAPLGHNGLSMNIFVIFCKDMVASSWSLSRRRHYIERFLHYWPFVRGIRQLPVDSPQKGPLIWSRQVAFVVSMGCGINIWVEGDLRRHGDHVTSSWYRKKWYVYCFVKDNVFTIKPIHSIE